MSVTTALPSLHRAQAYAKLHGCYEAIVGGQVREALRDLTGGLGYELPFKHIRGGGDCTAVLRQLHVDGQPKMLRKAALAEAFRTLDTEGTGMVTEANLQRLFEELGIEHTNAHDAVEALFDDVQGRKVRAPYTPHALTHAHTHAHTRTYTCTHMHTCTHACTRARTHTPHTPRTHQAAKHPLDFNEFISFVNTAHTQGLCAF